jgi:hypothetical protein
MVNISTILAALLLTGNGAVPPSSPPAQQVEISQPAFTLGKDSISALRAAYEKGEYKEFLTQMDAEYQQALSGKGLDGLMEMRKKEVPADQQKWEGKVSALTAKKNRDLLQVLSDRDGSVFAEKVRSLTANVSTPEQEKAINRLYALVQMAPQTGVNADENKLIDIDVEYEFKSLHATMPMSDLTAKQRQDYQLILRMDKMVAASKQFQDHALKQAVGLAAANLDARLARNLDGADLNAFVKGKVKPANETQAKIVEILSSYQGQFSDLMKEIAGSH